MLKLMKFVWSENRKGKSIYRSLMNWTLKPWISKTKGIVLDLASGSNSYTNLHKECPHRNCRSYNG